MLLAVALSKSIVLPGVQSREFLFPWKKANNGRRNFFSSSYSYQLSQPVSFLECGGGFNVEIAGRLSALWRDGEFCPYMHSYFSITFMNLNHCLCCFISRRTWSCCRSPLPSLAQPFLLLRLLTAALLPFFIYPPFPT